MRYIVLLCCFLIAPAFTEAQTYYVAVVKGEVTYNGKLLKKRAKTTTKGDLRFGSPEAAYIRVSGPGGVYTFRAKQKNTRGEFITSLSQELFPQARAREMAYVNSLLKQE